MLRRRKPEAEAFYWRRVRPWTGQLSKDELEEAVNSLLQNGRPKAAVDALSGAINVFKKKPSWKIVADAVDLVSSSPIGSVEGDFNTMSVWELCEVMKYLQSDPTADKDRLVMLEWRLLPLARHDYFEPKVLHSELSRNAGFFAEVISAVYRAKDQPKVEDNDPRNQHLAEAAYTLLESWEDIPGRKSDGTIDGDVLSNWVTKARSFPSQYNRRQRGGGLGEFTPVWVCRKHARGRNRSFPKTSGFPARLRPRRWAGWNGIRNPSECCG